MVRTLNALMNMFKRTQGDVRGQTDRGSDGAGPPCVACDETGLRIESVNAFRCVFCRKEAAFHSADLSPTLNSLDRRSVQRPPRMALTRAFQGLRQLGHGLFRIRDDVDDLLAGYPAGAESFK